MSKVLIIGCGGVASVAIHKCCQVPEVFTEICIASRTKAKCDKLAAELAPKTTTKITTAQVDADHVDEVIALLTTAVGFVTLPALLRLINTPAEILDTAVLYGRIYLLGLPFLMPYDLSKECVMGCGDSKTPLKVIVATSAMNIVLDLVLVGPFGVAGAAAATAAAQVAGAVYMVAFLRRTQMDAAFSLRMLKARYARIFSGCQPQQYSARPAAPSSPRSNRAAGRPGCGSHCRLLLRRQAVQPADDAGVRLCAVHSVLYCAKTQPPSSRAV